MSMVANDLKVNISLDNQYFKQKPVKKTIAIISSRIPKLISSNKLENLAMLTGEKGLSWCPAIFSEGKRRIDNFKSQQVFALDFDDGITWEEVKTRADRYRLPICFAYETFSSVNTNKFRVALCCDVEITDSRVAKIIQVALMEIFPECDKACKDCCRMFFGGKNLFYLNKNINSAVFNISDLMLSLVEYYKDTDNGNCNVSRRIKKYAECVGIQLKNVFPWIDIIGCDSKTDVSGALPIIYIIEHAPHTSKNNKYIIHLADKVKKKTKNGKITFSVSNTKTGKRELVRSFNFDELADKCRLYSEFTLDNRWCYHQELWGMATNLCQIKGGAKRFIDTVQNSKYDTYTEKDWGYYTNYIQKLDYMPQQCDNFCPYADECSHAKNMILTAKTKRNTIVELENDLEFVSLHEAEQDLTNKFLQAQLSNDENIHVLIGQTGLGKSQVYIDMLNNADKPYIIAVPTHKLKDEIYNRCVDKEYEVLKTPALPDNIPKNVSAEIERLYSLGAAYSAGKYIRKIAKEQSIPELNDYIEQLNKVKIFAGHIITTHDRLLYFNEERFRTHNVIIDEDIIKTLLKINKVSVSDLLKIQLAEYICPFDLDDVNDKIKHVTINNFIRLKPIELLNKEDFEQDVADSINGINSNVLGFLESCAAYRSNDDVIHYIVKHDLPKQKVIILSATANEEIYKNLFSDRVKFYYCKQAAYQGNLVQYPQKSFSRECIKNDDELMRRVRSTIIGDVPSITFKQFKQNDSDLNFGGVEGHDAYNGQDIAVVGTPHLHEIVYKMYAVAMGIDVTDSEMKYQEINWNYYNFWFMTYSNEKLRNIQLWLIESELEQAVGRARLLRNQCSVFLFSNFPLKQAEFKYFN